jgi:PAS domain S-box-containing protein
MTMQTTSIKRKLMAAIMIPSTVVLVLACTVFMTYEFVTIRRNSPRALAIRAEMIAANSSGALAFQNVADATEVLSALKADTRTVAACLYDQNGRIFAKYPANASTDIFPTRPEKEGSYLVKDGCVAFAPVVQNGLWLGTVFLKSNLSALTERFHFYRILVLVVVATSVFVTFVLSTRLQRRIAGPILHLAETARGVSERKDYSLRTQKVSDDEIGLLTDSFNEMLAQIQAQDSALHRAHDDLERRVREVGDLKAALDEHAIVATTDARGKITYVNDKFCTISKYSREELLGQDHRIINSGHHSKEFIRNLWTTISEGRVWHGEIKNKAKDGSFYWVDTTIAPFLNEQGKPRQYVAIRADITERKQAEEEVRKLNKNLEQRVVARTAELAAANKELEAFCYSVSHDLRAPLRGLDGFSQALVEDYGDKLDATGKDLLQRISEASRRMDRLIDDMLNLSRLTRSELHRRPVDLSGVAHEVADELRKRDPQRQVELRIADDLKAEGDPELLRVALENLLGNAWKYTSKLPQAVIEFDRRQTNGSSSFFVRDNGVGFDMQYVGKLFSPFQRLHGRNEFPGTGVGLATVQRIIHRHGGQAWAEAEINKGATFYFTLS